MVCKHHRRHVCLIAALLCGFARADDESAPALMTDSRRGNCIACHRIPLAGIPEGAFGNIGPSLEGVGARLSASKIKQRIVDPRRESPRTLMPPYGSTEGLYRVQKPYEDRSILTDAEIEQVVAYLSALK
jgi:L-cysteine S-thiosulfotransferase